MIIGKTYRISVLTDRLLRLEYQPEGQFLDAPTQCVVNRTFPEVSYRKREEEGILTVETDALVLRYDGRYFSSTGLSVTLKETGETWHYSVIYGNSDKNYYGTARTLDETDGYVRLEPGIFGAYGYAVVDDSASAVREGESFRPRSQEELDLYFFGYGRDFYGGLKDFYQLFGETPMIPRYALGNWWSRYYPYSEESYLALLEKFRQEEIPLSVAVIDMDWHITEVDEKYGTGWTGFTWNPELFPDYRRFLSALKDRKLAVTLNLHPADGIRAFEAMYREAAQAMGIDPDSEETVEFDLADPKFRKVYFETVLHPYEKDGVDFWWIDWQQGTGKGNGEVDPLFLLNHYHYEDQKNRSIRPMIFSRYAGVGSHRYPVGFSGDTRTTWQSLAFQPYFTSTASNVGYGWWSHDIGGHMLGDKDTERLVRWVQFGIFSPIMRLHSSNNPFLNKEPWVLGEPYHEIVRQFMRLRHRLIPYLYTMTFLASKEGRPLIQPMYYLCPEEEGAYEVSNEFGFGTELLVCAVTEKEDPELRMASVNALIPEGRWYDIFQGSIYEGKKKRRLYRELTQIPVLLKAGGIVPESISDRENGVENPSSLQLLIGGGGDGAFRLYEDDGISMEYQKGMSVSTGYRVRFSEEAQRTEFTIGAAEGALSLIPSKRSYRLLFYGLSPVEGKATAKLGTSTLPYAYDRERNILTLELEEAPVTKEQQILLEGFDKAENRVDSRVFHLLDEAWMENKAKERIYRAFSDMKRDDFLLFLSGDEVSETIKDALREILT